MERIQQLQEELLSLQALLKQSDYKVIKCAEASLVKAEMPYDEAELHAERQAWRDRINEIEAEIVELEEAENEAVFTEETSNN